MEGWSVVILVVVIVAAVLLGIALLIPYLIKRGVNVSGAIAGTGEVLNTADLVVDGLIGMFPGQAALTVVDKIIEYAKQAVRAAEQMYKATQIEAEQRKAEATKIIYECLKVADIEVTPDMEKVVTGLVEAAVLALPKTHSENIEDGICIDDWDEAKIRAFCEQNELDITGCEDKEAIFARLDELAEKGEGLKTVTEGNVTEAMKAAYFTPRQRP